MFLIRIPSAGYWPPVTISQLLCNRFSEDRIGMIERRRDRDARHQARCAQAASRGSYGSVQALRALPLEPGASLCFFVVAPRRGLRPRHDPGDVRIFAVRSYGLCGFPVLRLETTGGLGLLFFLTGSFARALVLRRS
jgi:hypothetical protein